MNDTNLKDLLQQFESRLMGLEKLALEVRAELRERNDLPQKEILLETLERTLLHLIKPWQLRIRHAINAPELYTDETEGNYIQLDFVLGHARALSREFDMDTSWSGSNNGLKRLINEVSFAALAALFCMHDIPVSEMGGLILNDDFNARNLDAVRVLGHG